MMQKDMLQKRSFMRQIKKQQKQPKNPKTKA